jgi:23S rRNA pseudouridine1911/1915/1917 synthase
MKGSVLVDGPDWVVLNKPSGLSLATSRSDPDSALKRLLSTVSEEEVEVYGLGGAGVRLVHRLDVGTSGTVLVALTVAAHRRLSQLLQGKEIRRTYLGVAWGAWHPPSGRLGSPLGPDPSDRRRMRADPDGKPALTQYRVLGHSPSASLVTFALETGRTHQIRVHSAVAGHPLVGDDLYGVLRAVPAAVPPSFRRTLQAGRLLLHAWTLQTPGAGTRAVAPLPPEFLAALKGLELPAPADPPPEA